MRTAPLLKLAATALVAVASTVAVPAGAVPATARGCGTVTGGAAKAFGRITDVRLGEHRHFDRFVVEFRGARVPHFAITAKHGTAFRLDPSNRLVHLRGTAALKLVFSHATGVGSYNGPDDFVTGFPELREALRIGDFEAVTTWGLGLRHAACGQVSKLRDPARLVIDVAH